MNKLSPANEPIGAATVATLIAWVAAKVALDMDLATATAAAAVVLGISQWVARRFSTPVGKAERKIDEAYVMMPGDQPKPTL